MVVAHIGRCTIRDVTSGETLATVSSPEEKDIYPVVPVGFICDDRYIICRIDLSMTLIVSEWHAGKGAASRSTNIVISDTGSTISSNCMAISKDEQFLMCWPYGCIEIYSIPALLLQLQRKALRISKVHFLLLLQLISSRRAHHAAAAEHREADDARSLSGIFVQLSALDASLVRIVFSYF
jgi:hypothetical protein